MTETAALTLGTSLTRTSLAGCAVCGEVWLISDFILANNKNKIEAIEYNIGHGG